MSTAKGNLYSKDTQGATASSLYMTKSCPFPTTPTEQFYKKTKQNNNSKIIMIITMVTNIST